MPDNDKIDLIHDMCIELRSQQKKMLEEQTGQGKLIATLVERSTHHETRIDRVEEVCHETAKKSGSRSGGVSGALGGFLAGMISGFIGK